jgi:tRNA(fMet)-specific endonuclease VapC
MEKFILDTCTWIEFSHERNGVKEKVDSKDVDQIFASEVTLAELTYGAINSEDYKRHIKEPEWLRQYVTIYEISDVFEEYGQIRCALNKISKNKAKEIGQFDMLIGATALHCDFRQH